MIFIIPVLKLDAQLMYPTSSPADRGLQSVAAPLNPDNLPIGRQILVAIAIDSYSQWMPLRNPVKDARKLVEVLQKRYFIDETIQLYNQQATRRGIIRAFEDLVERGKPEDSILIYYAGHGHIDQLTETGAWIPQDAGTDRYEQQNWIPNAQIRTLITKMKARHVLLISDSCFSGDLLNTSRNSLPDIDSLYLKNAFSRKSRQIISSGALESVPDESAFTKALIGTLESNTRQYLDPLMIFGEVRLMNLGTTPLFGDLKDSQSQTGGSYLLFLRAGQTAATSGPVILTEPYAVDVLTEVDGRPYRQGDILPVGRMLSVTHTSPDAISLDYNTAKIALEQGETRTLSLPSGTFSIPYLPDGATVMIGSKIMNTEQSIRPDRSYVSPKLPQGLYRLRITRSIEYSATLRITAGRNIEPSGYRSETLTFLEKKKASLENKSRAGFGSVRGWTSLITGIAGAAAAVFCYQAGDAAMNDYRAATDSAAAARARMNVQLLEIAFWGSAGAGGLGLGLAPLLWKKPADPAILSEIRKIDEAIRRLENP